MPSSEVFSENAVNSLVISSTKSLPALADGVLKGFRFQCTISLYIVSTDCISISLFFSPHLKEAVTIGV